MHLQHHVGIKGTLHFMNLLYRPSMHVPIDAKMSR